MTNIITQREHKQIYRDGDKVVKIFDETFSKADVLNEALNLARIEETSLKTPVANPDKIKNNQLFRLISVIPTCVFVRNTIPHAITSTTTVLMAVARLEFTPSIPTLAKIEVNAAKIADSIANINHILRSSQEKSLIYATYRDKIIPYSESGIIWKIVYAYA